MATTYSTRGGTNYIVGGLLALLGATWIGGVAVFGPSGLKIADTASDHYTTIKQNSDEGANRVWNLPALGGDKTAAAIDLAQSFSAAQTFTARLNAQNSIYMSDGAPLSTNLVDDDYFPLWAVDNDDNLPKEVGRIQGAAQPYIAFGPNQDFKFGASGMLTIADTKRIQTGAVDDDYFALYAVDNDDQSRKEVARVSGAAGAAQYFGAGGTQEWKWYQDGTGAFGGAGAWSGIQTFDAGTLKLKDLTTGNAHIFAVANNAGSGAQTFTFPAPGAAGKTVAVTGLAQEFTAAQTFPASGVKVNDATGNDHILAVGDNAGNGAQTYTLPVAGAGGQTLAALNLAQTFTQHQTLANGFDLLFATAGGSDVGAAASPAGTVFTRNITSDSGTDLALAVAAAAADSVADGITITGVAGGTPSTGAGLAGTTITHTAGDGSAAVDGINVGGDAGHHLFLLGAGGAGFGGGAAGAAGKLIVRQAAGTPGTDEMWLYDDGTYSYVTTKQDNLKIFTSGAGAIFFGPNQSTRFTMDQDEFYPGSATYTCGRRGDPWGAVITEQVNIVNDTEGGTGSLNRKTSRELHTLAAAGTSVTTTITIPSGARLIGVSMCVNTAVSDSAGDDTWSAAYSGGNTGVIVAGAAAAQNTKVDVLYSETTAAQTAVTTGATEITFTPNGGNFTGGVIEIVAYYESLTSLANP